ncbi:HAMP domain-containing sensor histidine kinase [Cryobacterium sp. PH31-L1]|uniref:sensor histidine kinase n=1 Tax=Cryobacterium sp. PH31-L1 TaxID=3046199 RepID=UPI0024B8966D|nr:HAMP domain-containing sensor histidine kinase [Cryobacterium sp. PH31-L1]MDJ0378316.1 HAMP domain-containing sensor histidine kinase [Cryobacterium sp. PH31-L1]
MSDIGSRPKAVLVAVWAVFAGVNCYLTFALPGNETIPYHLVWASFALLYGLCPWPRRATMVVFAVIMTVTGIALIRHAMAGIIAWEECSETVLMGGIISLLIWHVNRQWTAQARLRALQQADRYRSEQRENAARFGSHEVRTRLTIARGYAQLIADQSVEHTVREDAGLVVAELVKASALATNLLTLVRVVEPSAPEPVNVDRMLAEILRRWSVTADRAWSARSAVGTVLGDNERLEAMLDCLLENAVRFTGPGDTIAMTAETQVGEMVLTVRDTGAGIPGTDLDTIFDIFRTASTAGERAGSGLGLAIVKAAMEARDGTVSVTSSLGRGTTFTLRFPVEPAPPAQPEDSVFDPIDQSSLIESADVRF